MTVRASSLRKRSGSLAIFTAICVKADFWRRTCSREHRNSSIGSACFSKPSANFCSSQATSQSKQSFKRFLTSKLYRLTAKLPFAMISFSAVARRGRIAANIAKLPELLRKD
jgi:hypothetical protein